MTTQTAAHGAALKPLSRNQIRALILLAREAYGLEFPAPLESFDAWRRRHCMMTVERAGLRECLNEDYLPLKAHFAALAGHDDEAREAETKAAVEPRAWDMAAFDRECRKASDVMPDALAYAAGFIRNKRGCELEDADHATIWHAIYVVRRRAAQLRRKESLPF